MLVLGDQIQTNLEKGEKGLMMISQMYLLKDRLMKVQSHLVLVQSLKGLIKRGGAI